jgi:hypothetical protein
MLSIDKTFLDSVLFIYLFIYYCYYYLNYTVNTYTYTNVSLFFMEKNNKRKSNKIKSGVMHAPKEWCTCRLKSDGTQLTQATMQPWGVNWCSARSHTAEAGIQCFAATVDLMWHAWISRVRERVTAHGNGKLDFFFFFFFKGRCNHFIKHPKGNIVTAIIKLRPIRDS